MSEICTRMKGDTKMNTECIEDSQIQKFYAEKTVFMTGSTGYMGKCLVEKILRGCPDLKRIYVLVRPKRGSSMEERMKKYFDDVLFDTVRKVYPDYESKVQAIEGDLGSDDLGISETDRNTLIEEVDYIFHNASNVKFNEKISIALKINVLGTMAMINLAKTCKKIKSFLYVSTAYSQHYREDIEGKAYPPPVDANMVQDIIAADKVGMTDKELKEVLGKYQNAYAFTKATAEGLVDQMGKEVSFSCIVYRPTQVISSWKEPVRGWCSNLNGPTFMFVGIALGIIHIAYILDRDIDFVPVDMCINSIIVSMWDATKNRAPISGSFIYNYGSSVDNPITVRRVLKWGFPDDKFGTMSPSMYSVSPKSMICTECMYHFRIVHILYHFIPALIIDGYLLLRGKKTQALSTFKKTSLHYFTVERFINGVWRVHITEINNAIDRMNSIDRELFFCDIRKIDWVDYCKTYWEGLRVYLLKDPLSTVPAAIKRYRKMQITINILKYTLLLSIVYMIVSYLGFL